MQLESARRFVNRETEIGLVEEKVRQLQQGMPAQHCVVNFYGVPGIGKTALLADLENCYRKNEKIFTITLSVEPLFQLELSVAKVRFLKIFIEDNIVSSSIREKVQQLQDMADEKTVVNVLDQLTNYLSSLEHPLLLFIDAWERAPEALFSWFEHTFLLPLVRRNQIVCVLGSQAALRWRQFEVRRRVQAYQMSPLDLDATQQQVSDAAPAGLEKAVFAITFGHPFANEVVYQQLKPEAEAEAWLEAHRVELAQSVIESLYKRLLVDVNEELKSIFRIMSLFREFNVYTLREVLPNFNKEFRNRSQSSLLLSIKHLSETRLVSWNDELRAYQINPTIRRIFTQAVKWSEPDLYEAIRAAAISYYARLIQEVPVNRNIYLVEYFYQRLYKPDSELYNEHAIRSTIEKFVRDYYRSPDGTYVDTVALGELKTLFQCDQELQQALATHHIPPTLIADTLQELEQTLTTDEKNGVGPCAHSRDAT